MKVFLVPRHHTMKAYKGIQV